MAPLKRKNPLSLTAPPTSTTDAALDIFNSLVGPSKKARPNISHQDDSDSDDEGLIKSFTEKRNIKAGMQVVKQISKSNAKGVSGGGSFQSMGLHPPLLRALLINGFRIPTPIQRIAIPSLLASPPRDLVGMARTGSGKTLAYMVPLLQRLGGRHNVTFGARALILIPSRELALQIMKVGKDLSRAWHKTGAGHAGDGPDDDGSKSQSLRWSLIIGGESLNGQFDMVANNPDVIVATPGRLLHVIVEMNLDLRSIQFVVFDEADRLFEMGFATALHEILQRLPPSRQSLLFSATLPPNLVEFAKAGLQDPKLVRLDAESKVSSDLRMAFFSVKEAEKDACLLALLRDTIKVPLVTDRPPSDNSQAKKKQRKNEAPRRSAPYQTLIFAATKHHVEYLYQLLQSVGYAVSHIYGSLDQTARRLQMEAFKKGETDLLVVTDVAARGIDIPVLENVVNYDFPQGSRIFVHRVGRTARAGQQGWAWSFVTYPELPHLLDLQIFIGKELRTALKQDEGDTAYTDSLVMGTFPRDTVDEEMDHIRVLDISSSHLPTLRQVMARGHKLYERTKGKASQSSYSRAKEMMKAETWGLAGSPGDGSALHPVFMLRSPLGSGDLKDEDIAKRQELMNVISKFRPQETVLELGSRGRNAGVALMKERRKTMEKRNPPQSAGPSTLMPVNPAAQDLDSVNPDEFDQANEDTTKPVQIHPRPPKSYQDTEFYLSYEQDNAMSNKGYSLKDGASFAQNAHSAVLDLGVDEEFAQKARQVKWDKSKRKFVGAGEGADNVKLIKTENGTRLPATYRSGRFDEWKKSSGVRLPRVGEEELNNRGSQVKDGKIYKHQKLTEAKPLDPKQVGYERKARKLRKTGNSTSDVSSEQTSAPRQPGLSSRVRQAKSELKSADAIRKERRLKDKRRAKNARPSKKKRAS